MPGSSQAEWPSQKLSARGLELWPQRAVEERGLGLSLQPPIPCPVREPISGTLLGKSWQM